MRSRETTCRTDFQDRLKQMAAKNTSALNLDERKIIEEFCKQGSTFGRIAAILDRAHSTIKAEVRKNGGKNQYNAIQAQREADLRNQSRIRKLHKFFTQDQVEQIFSLAKSGKSMSYIACQLKVSCSTISGFLKQNNSAIPKRNYAHFIDRIDVLEEHIKLIYELIGEIKNDIKNK